MEERIGVVIFARHPTPGQVKTRLANDIGKYKAAELYQICAEKLVQVCRSDATSCHLFYSEYGEAKLVHTWLSPLFQGLTFQPQIQSPVLGDRMFHAMSLVLSQGFQKVIILGSDVPDLSIVHVNTAIATLDNYQVVFGPAEDGGYYLMGATSLPAGIFEGIAWSTDSVLQQNLQNVGRLGLRVAPLDTLPTLLDIDTVSDLERWLSRKDSGSPLQLGDSMHSRVGTQAQQHGGEATSLVGCAASQVPDNACPTVRQRLRQAARQVLQEWKSSRSS